MGFTKPAFLHSFQQLFQHFYQDLGKRLRSEQSRKRKMSSDITKEVLI